MNSHNADEAAVRCGYNKVRFCGPFNKRSFLERVANVLVAQSRRQAASHLQALDCDFCKISACDPLPQPLQKLRCRGKKLVTFGAFDLAVKASADQGVSASVPWLVFFDPLVTETASAAWGAKRLLIGQNQANMLFGLCEPPGFVRRRKMEDEVLPMRLTPMLLVVLAAPAHAQTGRELAHDMIVANAIKSGFAAETASVVADCYSTRMKDAEVEALVMADGDGPAQQAVIANMTESEAALGCALAVLE